MLEPDVCIYCGEQLSIWESTRHYCWNCNELTSETDDFGFTIKRKSSVGNNRAFLIVRAD